jgi:hypothetical protein
MDIDIHHIQVSNLKICEINIFYFIPI